MSKRQGNILNFFRKTAAKQPRNEPQPPAAATPPSPSPSLPVCRHHHHRPPAAAVVDDSEKDMGASRACGYSNSEASPSETCTRSSLFGVGTVYLI